jgi:hypothetical protein
MRIVPMGTLVRSSCGRIVGTVVGLSNDPPCRSCNLTPAARVVVSWPDGTRRAYCAHGILDGGRHDPVAQLVYGFRIKEARR